jgi:hypothetical protein
MPSDVPVTDVTEVMGWVDDGLADLLYDVEQGLHHYIEAQYPV